MDRARVRPEVIIDPGHGGTQVFGGSSPLGVEPQGLAEKHVNLELARRVAGRLGSVAQLTRDCDVNVPLRERARLAASSGARALVSIHSNAGSQGMRGSEVWLHERHDGRSAALGRAMHENLARVGPTRGLFQGPLAVLDPSDTGGVAACLVEADYLSDPQGRARLTSPGGLDGLADAIAGGVRGYLGHQTYAGGPNPTCDSADRTLPYQLGFTISDQIFSWSFRSSGTVVLNITAQVIGGGAGPRRGTSPSLEIRLERCTRGWITTDRTAVDTKTVAADGVAHRLEFTSAAGIYYFRFVVNGGWSVQGFGNVADP